MSNNKECLKAPPDEFVLKGGEPKWLYSGEVKDLVFKRSRAMRGLVYAADVSEWFRNGLPREVTEVEKK